MEEKTKIIFQKERKTGEIFSDSFFFLKKNYKDIFKKNGKILSPFYIIVIVSFIIATYYSDNYRGTLTGFSAYLITYLLQQFIVLLFITITQASTLVYIRDFINNTQYDEYSKKSYSKEVYRQFFPLLVLNIIVIFLVAIGTVFFIIPGIYLYIALLLSPAILVFQEKKPTESFSYSFELIKNNWWNIFVISILLGLILIVFSLGNVLITYFYTSFKTLFIESGNYMGGSGIFNDLFLLTKYILSLLVYFILYMYAVIVYAMTYFNIIEQKSHSNLFNEIEQIGINFEK